MDKLEFYFSVEEVNLILSALGEMPAKQSIGLINSIHSRVNQIRAQAQPENPES